MTPNAEHSEITGIFEVVPAIGTWAAYLLQKTAVPEFTWEMNNSTGEIIATLDDNGEVYEASMWWAYSCGTNTDGTKRRDFRICSLDTPCHCGIGYDGYCANLKSIWTREILQPEIVNGKRTYRAFKEAPGDGRWVAYFVDVKYKEPNAAQFQALYKPNVNSKLPKQLQSAGNKLIPVDKPGRLEFTSEVMIWPNTFPFADCVGEGCAGLLL